MSAGQRAHPDDAPHDDEALSRDMMLSRDRTLRAHVILDVARRLPQRYGKQGVELGAMTAFQRQPLVSDLLKLGLFSMNISRIIELGEANGENVTFSAIPSFLLGVGIHYAIEVAPTMASPMPGSPVVDVDRLERHVRRIEKHFGAVPVDAALVAEVAIQARAELMAAAENDVRLQDGDYR